MQSVAISMQSVAIQPRTWATSMPGMNLAGGGKVGGCRPLASAAPFAATVAAALAAAAAAAAAVAFAFAAAAAAAVDVTLADAASASALCRFCCCSAAGKATVHVCLVAGEDSTHACLAGALAAAVVVG
jgi:hypothetical protein